MTAAQRKLLVAVERKQGKRTMAFVVDVPAVRELVGLGVLHAERVVDAWLYVRGVVTAAEDTRHQTQIVLATGASTRQRIVMKTTKAETAAVYYANLAARLTVAAAGGAADAECREMAAGGSYADALEVVLGVARGMAAFHAKAAS